MLYKTNPYYAFKKENKSTCLTWGFCRLAVRKADPHSMSGTPPLTPFLTPAAKHDVLAHGGMEALQL